MASGSEPPELAPVNLAEMRCSFCHLPGTVGLLIAGPTPDVAICSACVALCTEILAEERPRGPEVDHGGEG